MVGMPLLNLGTALGGLSQGYNQSQQQYMQRALQQLALQQAQSQQNAARLAGLGLQGGLLGRGNTVPQMGAQASLPGITRTPGQATSPIPPPSQQQPPSAGSGGDAVYVQPDAAYLPWAEQAQRWNPDKAIPSDQMNPAQGNGNQGPEGSIGPEGPQGPAGQAGQVIPLSPQQGGDDTPSWMTTPIFGAGGTGTVLGQGGGQAPSLAPPPAATTSGTGAKPTRPATAKPAEAQPAEKAPSASGNVAVNVGNQQFDVPQLFNVLDPSKLAQGLARLAPNADPADIYQATSDLLKLSSGNKAEQLQAAYLAKLMGINLQVHARHEDVETQQAGAGVRTAAGIAGRKEVAGMNIAARGQIAAANQEIRRAANANLKDYRDQTLKNAVTRLAQQAAAQGNTTAGRAISQQLRAIQIQLNAIKPADGVSYSDEQVAQQKQLATQAQRLGDQLANSPDQSGSAEQ